MRAAKRPTAQWRPISRAFSVVPDFVVETVVTRFPQTSIPFGRLLNLHSPGRPHGYHVTGTNMLRLRKQKSTAPETPILQPNAAGVDVGANEIYIAVPADRDSQAVRRFRTFTGDLKAAADWLKRCGIESVAMESTSVYWIPFFQILEESGFTVFLVNARHSEERPRPQVGRRRLSMAAIPALGGTATRLLQARAGGMRCTFGCATSRKPGADRKLACAAHAKGA